MANVIASPSFEIIPLIINFNNRLVGLHHLRMITQFLEKLPRFFAGSGNVTLAQGAIFVSGIGQRIFRTGAVRIKRLGDATAL